LTIGWSSDPAFDAGLAEQTGASALRGAAIRSDANHVVHGGKSLIGPYVWLGKESLCV
jgi:hypothetical protein